MFLFQDRYLLQSIKIKAEHIHIDQELIFLIIINSSLCDDFNPFDLDARSPQAQRGSDGIHVDHDIELAGKTAVILVNALYNSGLDFFQGAMDVLLVLFIKGPTHYEDLD